MNTEFILTKYNIECRTTSFKIVNLLKKLGWKVKHSELSELI
jgi:hypothetical protein